MRLLQTVLQSRPGRYVADLAVRKFGGAPFLGPTVRIVVDSWRVDYLDVDWVMHHMARATPVAWAEAWCQRAGHYSRRADEFVALGMVAGARAMFAKAALYYQAGSYALDVDSPLQAKLSALAQRMHGEFGRLCDPPMALLDVPFRSGTVYAYLRLPPRRPLPPTPWPPRNGIAEPRESDTSGHAQEGDPPVRWPVVVVVPGLGSTKVQPDYDVDLLLDRGLAVCVVDLPGHGQSRAALPLALDSYSAVTALIDALAARPEVDTKRIGLLGTSLGGAVVLRAAAEDHRPTAVASVAGFYEPKHWYSSSEQFVGSALRFAAHDLIGEYTRQLVDEITLRGHLRSIESPVLLVHGDRDHIVPIGECHAIAEELGDRAKVYVVKGGDHAATNVPEVRHIVADWLAQRLMGEPSTESVIPMDHQIDARGAVV